MTRSPDGGLRTGGVRAGDFLSGRKIVFVFGSLEVGGAERQGVLLASHLKQKGALVQVWGFEKPGALIPHCVEAGIPYRIVSCRFEKLSRRIVGALRLAVALSREKPDVLLPYTAIPNLICSLVWRLAVVKICIWNQRDEGLQLEPGRLLHRMAVRLAPFYISNSSHGKEFLCSTFDVPAERVRVIRNGVQVRAPLKSRALWREYLRADDTTFIACMVANLHPFKDHLTLIEAWSIIVRSFPADRKMPLLVLAGRFDGCELAVTQLIDRLKLQREVVLLGKVDDVAGLLDAVDLCVHSSFHEGCPNAVLEAMSAGLPVVGTDIPGVRDALGSAESQYLVPASDSEALAHILLRVALDEEERLEMGRANQQRAAAEFSPEAMCRQTAEFLSRCLQRTSTIARPA